MPKPTDPTKWKYQFSDDMTFSQKVVLIDPSNNKLLTLKRSSKSNNPGLWDLPGGNMIYGELHDEALIREIFEETGKTEISKPKPVIVTSKFANDGELFRLFIGYKSTTSKINVVLSDEHSEYKWVSYDEFINMDTKDAIKEVVRAAFE